MQSTPRTIALALLLSAAGTVAAVPAPTVPAAPGTAIPTFPLKRPALRPRASNCNGSPSFIGLSLITEPNYAATGSGVAAGYSNSACDLNTFIGGGLNNVIGNAYASISAGENNQIVEGPNAFIGGGTNNTIAGVTTGASVDSVIVGGSYNGVNNADSGIVAGTGNVLASSDPMGYVESTSDFIGAGTQNLVAANEAGVVAGQGNQIGSDYSFIGGGRFNQVWGGYADAAIAGAYNINHGGLSFIGAGENNRINGKASAVGAGYYNRSEAYGVFVGAGANNIGAGIDAFVGAGKANTASGTGAFVGAGQGNVASGEVSMIPGGYLNVAAGYGSFAGGVRSEALQNGTFVWSDDGGSTSMNLRSSGVDQFLVRSSGGIFFYTNPQLTCGVELTPGSQTWTSIGKTCAKPASSSTSRLANNAPRLRELREENHALEARIERLEARIATLVSSAAR